MHAGTPVSSGGDSDPDQRILGDGFWETPSTNRKPRFAGLSWAGQDSNLRSSDYESAALTS
jgi:hypothetical protein